jgi:hypothetical protein
MASSAGPKETAADSAEALGEADPVVGPAQGGAGLHQGAGVLQVRLGAGQNAGRLGEGVEVLGALARRAQGDSGRMNGLRLR